MNKAFVREPDSDARVPCPGCKSPGSAVGNGPVEIYVPAELRIQLLDAAWCCENALCEVVYFNMFEQTVRVAELTCSVYPYDINAPICACFGFTYDDCEADVREGQPTRIRSLLAKSQSPEAKCAAIAANGQCCMKEVQRLFMKLRSDSR